MAAEKQDRVTDTAAVELELPDVPAVPKSAAAERITPPGTGAAADRIIPPAPTASKSAAAERITPPTPAAAKPRVSRYTPASGLIVSVTVTDWHTDYSYYEQFVAAARRLRDYTADECPAVPFFSYMPQYSQMTPDQLRFYLYLRGEICEGRYPEADYGYLLLLLYETVNLSDISPEEYTLGVFLGILEGYRARHERLTVQLADWLCDFCLIHGCVPPAERVRPLLPELVSASAFPEFYIGLGADMTDPGTLLRYSSAYDYTKSRFSQGKNRPLFDRYMNGVLTAVLQDGSLRERFRSAMDQTFETVRDAYVGALCSPHIKKRLTVKYRSLARSHELRFLLSDLLKYTENRLRAVLGVRSRLSFGKLPAEIRRAADAYLDRELGGRTAVREEVPAYEKLYEPAASRLTPEAAAAIEEESWQTTRRLLEAFAPPEEDVPEETPPAPRKPAAENGKKTATEDNIKSTADRPPKGEPPADRQEPEKTQVRPSPAGAQTSTPPERNAPPAVEEPADAGLRAALTPAQTEFLRAALAGDAAAQKRAAAKAGMPADLMADGINDLAADLLGDIVLGDEGGYYTVLADYSQDIAKEFSE